MANVKFKRSLTKALYDLLQASQKDADALYFLGGNAENPNSEDVRLVMNGKDYSGVKKIETGSTAGTIKVDGVDVAVNGAVTDVSVKADKVSGATNGNFAGLDANGNLTDSGKKASDFATSTQGGKADTAVQTIQIGGTTLTKTNGVVDLPAYPTTLPASDVSAWAKASEKPTYTKSEVGLGNVTNDAQVKRSEMGVASGVATLGSDGKVPSTQLPSYVDDVIEGYYKAADGKFYTTYSGGTYSTEITGEAGKIYIDLGNGNKSYRWGGSAYAEIIASPGTTDSITEGSTNLFYTEARAKAVADAEIAAEIAKLDASKSQTAGTDGLALSVTEVDGKITAISGSIAANTYDAHGSAATALSTAIGSSSDAANADTINGAKAYADSLAGNYDAAGAAAAVAAMLEWD